MLTLSDAEEDMCMLALASLLMRFSDTKAWKARLASLKRCMRSDFFMISLFRTLPFRWIRCARDCLFLVPFFSFFALFSFVFSLSLFPTSFFFFKYDQMNTTFFPSSYASLSHLLFCGSFLVLFFFLLSSSLVSSYVLTCSATLLEMDVWVSLLLPFFFFD